VILIYYALAIAFETYPLPMPPALFGVPCFIAITIGVFFYFPSSLRWTKKFMRKYALSITLLGLSPVLFLTAIVYSLVFKKSPYWGKVQALGCAANVVWDVVVDRAFSAGPFGCCMWWQPHNLRVHRVHVGGGGGPSLDHLYSYV
jgi:hypothetical protein